MKKILLALVILATSFAGYSQKVIEFTTTTANDTLSVNESQVIQLINGTTSGASLIYYNTYGDFASKDVIERAGDTTAAVGASLTFTLVLAAGDTLDSLSVAGVKISSASVPYTSSATVTLDSIVSKINASASSYTASKPSGTTLKITAPKANAQAFNGQKVETFSRSESTIAGNQGVLAGGVSKGRNVADLSDRLFLLESGKYISADHVRVLIKKSSGCVVWLTDGRPKNIQTTTKCNTIADRLNAK